MKKIKHKNRIGSQVREDRTKCGMKQKELATRMAKYGVIIHHTAISKIETGSRPVSDFEVVALAKALNVSPDRLFGLDNNQDT